MIKKIFVSAMVFFIAGTASAQFEMGAFTATGAAHSAAWISDYQCLGINPANLGWMKDDKKIAVSSMEFGASIYSEALSKTDIKKHFIFNTRPLTNTEKIEAAKTFANSNLALNIDLMTAGASYQSDKNWGIAFTMRDRAMLQTYLNKSLSGIFFEGYNYKSYFDSIATNASGDTIGYAKIPQNLSQLAEGSKILGNWFREINLGFGWRFINNENFKVYLGAGGKYLMGFGLLEIMPENGSLNAFSAITPFLKFDYNTPSPSEITETGMKQVGQGFGCDFGGTVEFFKSLRFALSFNDIGYIKWDGNVYEGKDTLVGDCSNKGLDSYNLINNMGKILSDSGLFTWKGKVSRNYTLPTNMRWGVSIAFGEDNNVELGADVYVPFTDGAGSYDKAIIGIGANVRIVKVINLSAGFVTGGNYDSNIPLGVYFLAGAWEFGIASRDALTFFTKDNPTMSAVFGLLRFRFK
ncbi:MAG: DUF5723 family protein [Bacteroidales bacterium]|nr:DUF5723 family protein [Bacteroidales bacterium]